MNKYWYGCKYRRSLNTGLARLGAEGTGLVSFIAKSHCITPWMLAFEAPKVEAQFGIYEKASSSSGDGSSTEDDKKDAASSTPVNMRRRRTRKRRRRGNS